MRLDLSVTLTVIGTAKVLVNGVMVRDSTLLSNGDRVMMGNNYLFRLVDPHQPLVEHPLCFQQAIDEIQRSTASKLLSSVSETTDALDRQSAAQQAEYEAKLQLMQRQLEEARAHAAAASGRGGVESVKSLEEEIRQQAEMTKRLMVDSLRRRRQVRALEQQLAALSPSLAEANSMAKEMSKPVRFEVKLAVKKVGHSIDMQLDSERVSSTEEESKEDDETQSVLHGKTVEIVIRMINTTDGAVVTWSAEKFESRLYLMRDLYRTFTDQGFVDIDPVDDPFWDPPEPVEIGTCFVYTRALTRLVDISKAFQICSRSLLQQGAPAGKLEFSIFPLDDVTEVELDYLEEEDDPFKFLLNKSMKLQFELGKAEGLPERFAHNVFVSFSFFGNVYETKPITGFNLNADLSEFTWKVRVGPLTTRMLQVLQDGCIHVEVKGYTAAAAKQLAELEQRELERKRERAQAARQQAMMDSLLARPSSSSASRPTTAAASSPMAAASASFMRPASAAPVRPGSSAIAMPPPPPANRFFGGAPAPTANLPPPPYHRPESLVPGNPSLSPPSQQLPSQPSIPTQPLPSASISRPASLVAPGTLPAAPSQPIPSSSASAASSSPSQLGATSLLCAHCEERSGEFECHECESNKGALCSSCWALLHKAPRKQAHVKISVVVATAAGVSDVDPPAFEVQANDGPICQRCDELVAFLSCDACSKIYCAACDTLMHKAPSRASHVRQPIPSAAVAASSAPMCHHCDELSAVLFCVECNLSFCQGCANLMHKAPSKQAHQRRPI